MAYRRFKESKRDTRVYELKDGKEVVKYGITNDPNRRAIENANAGLTFTHINIITVALTRDSAEKREKQEIQRYQRQHGGKPPKYNKQKTY